MSAPLGLICEQVLLAYTSQERRDSTEWNNFNVAPFVYAAHAMLLHQYIETGQVGRNYGTGKPGLLGIESYTYSEPAVSSDFTIDIPADYVDLRYEAGITVIPLEGYLNPFVKVPYGFQFNGAEYMHMEGNLVYWVTPSRKIQFVTKPPTAKVGLLLISTVPDTGNIDMDAMVTFPAHLLLPIVDQTLALMGRPRIPDDSNNNRAQQPQT